MRRISGSDRKIGLDLLIALAIEGVVFVLCALLLWPFGKAALAWQLAKGFCIFLLAVYAAVCVSALLQKLFRIDNDPPSDAYVLVNLFVSACVQTGWAAFAALAVTGHAAGAAWLATAMLHFLGLVVSWGASSATGAFFQGHLYRTINAALSLAGYLLFAVWPAAARALNGWFFAFFGTLG